MAQKVRPELEEQPWLRVGTVELDGLVRVVKERVWVRWSSSRPVVVVEEVAGRPEPAAGKTQVVQVVGRPVVGRPVELEVVEEVGRPPVELEVVEEGAGNWVEEQKRKQPGLEVVEGVGRPPVEADIEA
jgi:hypothetical protein